MEKQKVLTSPGEITCVSCSPCNKIISCSGICSLTEKPWMVWACPQVWLLLTSLPCGTGSRAALTCLRTSGVSPWQKQQQRNTALCNAITRSSVPKLCVTTTGQPPCAETIQKRLLNEHISPFLRKNYICNWLSRILAQLLILPLLDINTSFKGKISMNGQSNILTPDKLLGIPICPEFSGVSPRSHTVRPEQYVWLNLSEKAEDRSGMISRSLLFIIAEDFITWGNRQFLLLLISFSWHVHDKQQSRWTLKKQRYFLNANASSNSQ